MIPARANTLFVVRVAAMISIVIAASARADPVDGLRIDLSESDPAQIEELPGILPAEIEQLRAAAGPGEAQLGERLAATGIAKDRLLRWAPFLVLPDRDPGRCVWKVRVEASRRSEKPLARRTRLRLDRGATSASFDGSARGTEEGGVDPRAWLAIRHPRGAGIRIGTIAGGFRGAEVWDDPLVPGRGVLSALGGLSMRDDGDSRGAIVDWNRWAGAAWSSENGSDGAALSADLGAVRGWGGSDRSRGWGSGLSIRRLDRDAAIVWSNPRGLPPVIRFSLVSGGSVGVSAVWSTRSRSDRRMGSLAARRAGRFGDLSWSTRTEMVVAHRKGDSQGRVEAAARWKGVNWGGDCRVARRTGSSSLEIGIDPRRGARSQARFEHRGRWARGRYHSFWSCRLARAVVEAARLECALLLRDHPSFAWPDPGSGVAGRTAARIGLTAALGGAHLRFQILAAGGEAGRNPAIGWRVELEHSAED